MNRIVCVSATALLLIVCGCTNDRSASNGGSTDVSDVSEPLSSADLSLPPVVRGESEPAIWTLGPGDDLTSASTSFTASVTRMSCHGGVTGTVLTPTIEEDDAAVVVTFALEAAPPGIIHACPSNDFVPVVVDLSEPLGERPLIDGGCRLTNIAQTMWCDDGSVRWKR